MAIDYKKEWKKFRHTYGKYKVQSEKTTPTPLDALMDFQIQGTITAREKLMEAYIKEIMTTDIGEVSKDAYNIRLFLYGCRCGTISVSKINFNAWCEKRKGGKNETK